MDHPVLTPGYGQWVTAPYSPGPRRSSTFDSFPIKKPLEEVTAKSEAFKISIEQDDLKMEYCGLPFDTLTSGWVECLLFHVFCDNSPKNKFLTGKCLFFQKKTFQNCVVFVCL